MPRTAEGVELPNKWVGRTVRVAVMQPHDEYRGDRRHPGEWAVAYAIADEILDYKRKHRTLPPYCGGTREEHALGKIGELHFIRILDALKILHMENIMERYWVSDMIMRPQTQPLNVDVKIRSPQYDLAMIPVAQFDAHYHDCYVWARLEESRQGTLWMGWLTRGEVALVTPGTLEGRLPTPSLYVPFDDLRPMWELFLHKPGH